VVKAIGTFALMVKSDFCSLTHLMKKLLFLSTCLMPILATLAEPPELITVRASYQKQIEAATAPIHAKYLEYLEGLKKQLGGKGDVQGALAVQKEIDAIAALQKIESASGGDKIVIWNQNNGGKGDRGTKKVDVSLLAGGRELWSRKSLKIDWDAVKAGSAEVLVPTINADTLRIEVVDSVNDKGGLGEVEYFRGVKNIAKGGEVKVSAYWENNPKHTGAMLSDGAPGTYWLLPDGQKGWAEITLKP
jgi:hypothetical protein